MLWKSEAVAFDRGFLPLKTIIEIRDQQRLEQYHCSQRLQEARQSATTHACYQEAFTRQKQATQAAEKPSSRRSGSAHIVDIRKMRKVKIG